MLSIGPTTFIIVVQAILFLIMIVIVLLFLLRAKNKKLKAALQKEQDQGENTATASIEHYLTTEIKLTQGRFDLLYQDGDISSEVIAEPDWLALRKNFLEIEKELLASSNREDVFWIDIGKKLKVLLKNSYLVKRMLKEVEESDEEEIKEMKMLLKSQQDKFEELSSMLEGDNTEAEIDELKEKIMKLARSHKELSQCMFMLEDENVFLREQITALLK